MSSSRRNLKRKFDDSPQVPVFIEGRLLSTLAETSETLDTETSTNLHADPPSDHDLTTEEDFDNLLAEAQQFIADSCAAPPSMGFTSYLYPNDRAPSPQYDLEYWDTLFASRPDIYYDLPRRRAPNQTHLDAPDVSMQIDPTRDPEFDRVEAELASIPPPDGTLHPNDTIFDDHNEMEGLSDNVVDFAADPPAITSLLAQVHENAPYQSTFPDYDFSMEALYPSEDLSIAELDIYGDLIHDGES
ncbi:hypothetical protein JAAARDRAFT_59969 [Jaapia argillacea MUCL 33604]|uniref:Uncharacterized protein n=1 Tax=Jaapia argillacea MUCL 33604 TaxID=933084 RepID=A0A067PL12_9AGAM|nr:hypothetical protein JAAARDRAFT_59969 [Jaapia argillacea MUCL 33604]